MDAAAADHCLICHRSPVAVVALYVPDGGGPSIPYAVCATCWRAFSPPVLAGLAEQLLTERTP